MPLRKNADRICMPTDDARRQGLSADKKTGSCSWLLRTTGNDKGTVVCVNADGSVNYQGVSVNSDKYGLRPCLRLPAYAAKGKFPLMETRYDFTTYDKKTGDAKSWVSEYVEYYGEKTPVTYCREYWDDRYEYKNSKDWEYSGEDSRYYDEYGNLISVHTIWQDGKDVDWFKANYEYTYNKAGQITQAIQYEDQINQANKYEEQVPRYLIQYKYDSAGRKISEIQKEYDDPSEVVCTKLWTYDSMGNLLTYRKDGELEAENTYDRYGNRLTFYMAGEICEAYYAENYGEIPPMKRWGYNEEKRTYAPLSELQWQGVSP